MAINCGKSAVSYVHYNGVKFGTDYSVNSAREDPVQGIKDLSDGKGVDVSIDFVGSKGTLDQCVWSVCNGVSAEVVEEGLPNNAGKKMRFVIREKTIKDLEEGRLQSV